MLDAITMERRGIPAAAVGVEKLVRTTGRAMARIQGWPDFPIAVISHSIGTLEGLDDLSKLEEMARRAAPQIEAILLGKTVPEVGAAR